MIYHGDCLKVLKTLGPARVDSLVTDPPAGISFMGKSWDSDRGGRDQWIAWLTDVMKECLRVMKPGAHGLVWAIPRTSHWTATALENAGFEVRDVITHLFGQGFPKSLDISKAIDKANGDARPVVGVVTKTQSFGHDGNNCFGSDVDRAGKMGITSAASAASAAWQGWGTALKPASEHWILVRKPCAEKTVAANVLKYGTGGINIDECRIEFPDDDPNVQACSGRILQAKGRSDEIGFTYGAGAGCYTGEYFKPNGRFPANLVLSHSSHCTDEQCDPECAIRLLDEQSGTLKTSNGPRARAGIGYKGGSGGLNENARPSNSGGASRFFYCAKVSRSERNAGLEMLPDDVMARSNMAKHSNEHGESIARAETRNGPNATMITKNNHPTVKPIKLMRYLIRLITPPGGHVLDPFTGSGSTGVAAKQEGFEFTGIEMQEKFVVIATERINHNRQTLPSNDSTAIMRDEPTARN